MAPLAQLSWGLGRLGGGEARAFRFVHVEGERAAGGLRKGSQAKQCSNLLSRTWPCGLDHRLHLSFPLFSHLHLWDDVGCSSSREGAVASRITFNDAVSWYPGPCVVPCHAAIGLVYETKRFRVCHFQG